MNTTTQRDTIDPGLLAPPPRHVETGGRRWAPERRVAVVGATGGLSVAVEWLAAALARHGLTLHREASSEVAGASSSVRLDASAAVLCADGSRPCEGYRLDVGRSGVEVRAATAIGRFRGLTTLVQWLDLHPAGSPDFAGLRVLDRPDLVTRGVLLDVSRNRVPREAELEGFVDRLARLKISQLQLYFEHTFAYAGHESVWRDWSPITGDQLRRLDAVCRARFIELVPHQNSFGHFHRWLVHEPYRRLAECPDGFEHPFSPEPEPFGLCATDPRSVDLLRDLYGQLVPHVLGDELAVGLDEAIDLGAGRSRAECARRGRRAVYLDFVRSVHGLVREHGRRMQMWGDMLIGDTAFDGGLDEVIDELPDNTTYLAWGYEPDHPFDRDLPRFARVRDRGVGRRYFVCPGTGAWNTFTGRGDDAVINLASAARAGVRHGADGYLITDWGDHGHLQPPPISWPGVVAGACFAWNVSAADRALADPASCPLATWLDHHVMMDRGGVLGRALVELGNAQRLAGVRSPNGAPLFFALMMAERPAAERRGEGLAVAGLDAVRERLAAVLEPLGAAQPGWSGAVHVADELRWAADVARLSASLVEARLQAGEGPPDRLPAALRHDLVDQLQALAERLRPLWLQRSRPGGLDASTRRLLRVVQWLE